MNPEEYLAEVKAALDEYRFKDVSSLTEKIVPTEFQEKQIKSALNLLRRKRLFPELERAAGIFMGAGWGTPMVRRQWAQAVLDQNRVTQALSALSAMLQQVKGDAVEESEVQGLIGRVYKQLYVNEGGPENLVKAIQAYTPFWELRKGDYRWHGINLAALIARAQQDHVDPQTSEDPLQIARKIREEIEQSSEGVWDYGTAMEASVALGDEKTALAWAAKYVKDTGADAFELGSTLRQLKELWRLEKSPLGKKLLPVLEYALLERQGGTLKPMEKGLVDPMGFEAVWGSDSYILVRWMDTMYQRCATIARVFHVATGQSFGTGFLVRGDALNPNWGEAPVFVTNAHVVSTHPADEAPLRPEHAAGVFTRLPDRPHAKLGELLFTSPRVQLDVSILRVQPPPGVAVLASADFLLVPSQPRSQPERIYVIGHPKGGELAVSLYDNSLVGYQGDYIHYRSPTEGGSSGSPVFTRAWELIAIHHRAMEDLQANEGICIGPICTASKTV